MRKQKNKKKCKRIAINIIFAMFFITVLYVMIVTDNRSLEIFAAEQGETTKEDAEEVEITDVKEENIEDKNLEEEEIDNGNNSTENVLMEKILSEEEQSTNEGGTEQESDINKDITESFETMESKEDDIDESKMLPDIEESGKRDKSVVETNALEISVPIYNYDIVNVVVPTSYAVALNPYELPVHINDNTVSNSQVVARNYGIINKSTLDKIITVTLIVEDQNGGKIKFVDSKEAVLKADENTYAVYLAVVPADHSGIRIKNDGVDKNTTATDLADVSMIAAESGAVALTEGKNQIAFKLSKAVYQYADGKEIRLDTAKENDIENLLELTSLASDDAGVTAFTFDGVMNKQADWSKLGNGIKISVVYSYETAAGDEVIVNGTGAVVHGN